MLATCTQSILGDARDLAREPREPATLPLTLQRAPQRLAPHERPEIAPGAIARHGGRLGKLRCPLGPPSPGRRSEPAKREASSPQAVNLRFVGVAKGSRLTKKGSRRCFSLFLPHNALILLPYRKIYGLVAMITP